MKFKETKVEHVIRLRKQYNEVIDKFNILLDQKVEVTNYKGKSIINMTDSELAVMIGERETKSNEFNSGLSALSYGSVDNLNIKEDNPVSQYVDAALRVIRINKIKADKLNIHQELYKLIPCLTEDDKYELLLLNVSNIISGLNTLHNDVNEIKSYTSYITSTITTGINIGTTDIGTTDIGTTDIGKGIYCRGDRFSD